MGILNPTAQKRRIVLQRCSVKRCTAHFSRVLGHTKGCEESEGSVRDLVGAGFIVASPALCSHPEWIGAFRNPGGNVCDCSSQGHPTDTPLSSLLLVWGVRWKTTHISHDNQVTTGKPEKKAAICQGPVILHPRQHSLDMLGIPPACFVGINLQHGLCTKRPAKKMFIPICHRVPRTSLMFPPTCSPLFPFQ